MKSKIKNAVVNTRAEVMHDPIIGLVTAMSGGKGIEASERRGQVQFLESETLPSKLQTYFVDKEMRETRPLLESWGFVFGKVIGGDTLFMQARLPPGWKKKGSDHDMWSYIVDDQGRERCSVFYKAAFYDREAFLGVSGRYRYHREYKDEALRTKGPQRGVIYDKGAGDKVLFEGPWRENPPGKDYAAYKLVGEDMAAWAKENISDDPAIQWAKP